MAPLSASEKQKLLLQQEIAKLSGAISRHSTSSSSSYHPYRGRPSGRGSAPVRGRGRGRGRGGSYALDLRATNKTTTSSSAEPSRPSSSASVTGPGAAEEGEVQDRPAPVADAATAGPSESSAGWVKGKGKMGNMSLMTVEKRDKLRTQKSLQPRVPPEIQMLNSSATASGDKRVVIDGVIFQFEQDGKKLTRIGEAPSSSTGSTYTPTRKSLSFGGGKYRRTMKGNLILKKPGSPAKSQQLCRYFTKTGRCNFGLTCPHIHDPARVSICPRYLRGTCTLGASCPLSHTPSPHNTPSCLRFQATSSCSVPGCPYPHVRVSPDAPVCEAFARGGWCPKESGTCEDLHVWECPEFRAKGTCSKGGKCGLRHVVRAETSRKGDEHAASSRSRADGDGGVIVDTVGEGGFEEQDSFIHFDQGSPGAVVSEGSEDGGGSGEESDEEMGDDQESEEDDDDDDDDESGESASENDDEDEEEIEEAEGDDDSRRETISPSPIAQAEVGKQTLPPSRVIVSAPSPASAPYVQSDNMDTDEVDEDAVLSVV